MNPRQAVVIAMLLSATVFLLANMNPSSVTQRLSGIKQVPVTPTPGFGGGQAGNRGGAGGAF